MSADLAQMPKTPSASDGTGKEHLIGNQEVGELGSLQSAESGEKEKE